MGLSCLDCFAYNLAGVSELETSKQDTLRQLEKSLCAMEHLLRIPLFLQTAHLHNEGRLVASFDEQALEDSDRRKAIEGIFRSIRIHKGWLFFSGVRLVGSAAVRTDIDHSSDLDICVLWRVLTECPQTIINIFFDIQGPDSMCTVLLKVLQAVQQDGDSSWNEKGKRIVGSLGQFRIDLLPTLELHPAMRLEWGSDCISYAINLLKADIVLAQAEVVRHAWKVLKVWCKTHAGADLTNRLLAADARECQCGNDGSSTDSEWDTWLNSRQHWPSTIDVPKFAYAIGQLVVAVWHVDSSSRGSVSALCAAVWRLLASMDRSHCIVVSWSLSAGTYTVKSLHPFQPQIERFESTDPTVLRRFNEWMSYSETDRQLFGDSWPPKTRRPPPLFVSDFVRRSDSNIHRTKIRVNWKTLQLGAQQSLAALESGAPLQQIMLPGMDLQAYQAYLSSARTIVESYFCTLGQEPPDEDELSNISKQQEVLDAALHSVELIKNNAIGVDFGKISLWLQNLAPASPQLGAPTGQPAFKWSFKGNLSFYEEVTE